MISGIGKRELNHCGRFELLGKHDHAPSGLARPNILFAHFGTNYSQGVAFGLADRVEHV